VQLLPFLEGLPNVSFYTKQPAYSVYVYNTKGSQPLFLVHYIHGEGPTDAPQEARKVGASSVSGSPSPGLYKYLILTLSTHV
jgi:hypothetical protein